ncbi:hypothetical protein EPN87_03285 [archaeon]|nr:MAG: hypothetical protein EPN87_03285 [archaeon]
MAILIAAVAVIGIVFVMYPKNNDSQSSPTSGLINDISSIVGRTFAENNENRVSYEVVTEKERATLPECADTFFTQSPVDIKDITSIEPIGSTSPPEHALASSSTDVYIAVDTQGTEKTVPLYAPADIWITSIQPRYNITSDPEDHVIQYAFCRDVFGIVDHVKSFSAEMKEIVDNYQCKYGGKPGDQNCPILLLKPVKAGTLLGTVGRMQGNFNFGTWDLRHNNSFINTSRYEFRSLHSTCPFNYYPSPLKEQMTSLLGRADKNCGTVEYDIAGTAQGEWFYGNAGNKMHGDWFNHLFLGYHNTLPEAAVISVGGVISAPLKWVFLPQTSGTKNVGFQYVTDNKVYCYENNGSREGIYWNYEKGPTGRILIQLVDSNNLKAEYQPGTCDGGYSFANPRVYQR